MVRGGLHLLQLLFWSEVVSVSTRLFSAISGSSMVSGIALSADHFVAIVFLGQYSQGGFDDTTSESEDQMKG